MKIIAFVLGLMVCSKGIAQVIENAKAYENTYLSLSMFDTASNGHVIGVFFVNHYTEENPYMEVGRIDMTTGNVTYKMTTALSSSSALWAYIMYPNGDFYIAFNTNGRTLYRMNFRDSIEIDSLGNPFLDQQALVYSMSIGTDGNLYMGASSGDTYFAYLDIQADTFVTYPAVNTSQQYILSIAGDSSWIYLQAGQSSRNELWAVRKSDGYKKLLQTVPASTRFDTRERNDLQVNINSINGRFVVTDTTLTPIINYTGTDDIYFYSVYYGPATPPNKIRITANYFDEVSNQYSYATNTGLNNTVDLETENIIANIRMVINDRYDPNRIYYVRDYYGSFYCYDKTLDSSWVIGKTGFNIYSFAQIDRHQFAIGNYPSGETCLWDKSRDWTAWKYDSVTQTITGINDTTNPRHLVYFRSETPGEFHHTEELLYDSTTNILIAAGDVIRTGNGFSVGAYNLNNDSAYAIDWRRFPASVHFRAMSFIKRNIIAVSTTNTTNCKIWFYNYVTNQVVDSIQYEGWTNYGRQYAVGSKMYGLANNRYYMANLAKGKELLYDSTIATTSYLHRMLPDGRVLINSWISAPTDWLKTKYIGNEPEMLNCAGWVGSYYYCYGENITEIPNVVAEVINIRTAPGKEQYVRNLLTSQ